MHGHITVVVTEHDQFTRNMNASGRFSEVVLAGETMANQEPCCERKLESEDAENYALPCMLKTTWDAVKNEDYEDSCANTFPFAIYPRCEILIRQDCVPPLEKYPSNSCLGKARPARSVPSRALGSSKQHISTENEQREKKAVKVSMQSVAACEEKKEDVTSEVKDPRTEASAWNQLQQSKAKSPAKE